MLIYNLFVNFVVVNVFCCTASSSYLKQDEEHHRFKHFESSRNKRQDDIWSWGYVDIYRSNENKTPSAITVRSTEANLLRSSNNNTITTPIISTTNSTPCSPFVPSVRDFRKPGRRISEVKCLDYVWDIKVRDDAEKHTQECLKYRRSNRGPFSPHFAIGGRNTEPGEFPHMGAIGWKASIGTWIFKCGSSLISEKFVLTAAHCSSASPRDTSIADPIPKIVRLGDKNILDKGANGLKAYDKNIINIVVHPKYAAPIKYYDIALMELDSAVEFTRYIQPACLWNNFDLNSLGKAATLTGWGVVEIGGTQISPELQAAVVDVIDSKQCDDLLGGVCNRNWCGVMGHQICAGKLAGGVDACQGDSGGPLQVKMPIPITSQGAMHYLIGVTSFGIDCALANLPGIYTRVSSFVDWIEENVWNNKSINRLN